jgi:hypothetical protein
MTEQVETHLRNAQDELREEHVEIALYTRIEVFATEVGDRDTAALARAIRRDEERMAKFLAAELGRLVKALVRAEIPRDQRAASKSSRARRTTGRSRTATSRSTTSRSTGSRATTSRATHKSFTRRRRQHPVPLRRRHHSVPVRRDKPELTKPRHRARLTGS